MMVCLIWLGEKGKISKDQAEEHIAAFRPTTREADLMRQQAAPSGPGEGAGDDHKMISRQGIPDRLRGRLLKTWDTMTNYGSTSGGIALFVWHRTHLSTANTAAIQELVAEAIAVESAFTNTVLIPSLATVRIQHVASMRLLNELEPLTPAQNSITFGVIAPSAGMIGTALDLAGDDILPEVHAVATQLLVRFLDEEGIDVLRAHPRKGGYERGLLGGIRRIGQSGNLLVASNEVAPGPADVCLGVIRSESPVAAYSSYVSMISRQRASATVFSLEGHFYCVYAHVGGRSAIRRTGNAYVLKTAGASIESLFPSASQAADWASSKQARADASEASSSLVMAYRGASSMGGSYVARSSPNLSAAAVLASVAGSNAASIHAYAYFYAHLKGETGAGGGKIAQMVEAAKSALRVDNAFASEDIARVCTWLRGSRITPALGADESLCESALRVAAADRFIAPDSRNFTIYGMRPCRTVFSDPAWATVRFKDYRVGPYLYNRAVLSLQPFMISDEASGLPPLDEDY